MNIKFQISYRTKAHKFWGKRNLNPFSLSIVFWSRGFNMFTLKQIVPVKHFI
jgi:hypothetical protein